MTGPPDAVRDGLRSRYDLGQRIGSGGMADVYLAQDCRHQRPVAVKILRREVGDSVGADRFLREITTAARLQHPNILPVYDSGEVAGALFYVMPYVEGGSLRERLRAGGPFTWGAALPLVREVADALAFAHVRNVLHRDIKPENILFLAAHAVVADFGIARAIVESSGGDRLTLDGEGLGTPEYMSPEQAFGETEIDARSDVYSLACVLFEMLQGTPPYTAASPWGVLLKKSRDPVPTLRVDVAAGVPPQVEGVLRRALDPDPAKRFATVEEMVAALGDSATAVSLPPPARSRSEVPVVAVLPFANLGGSADDAYLSDGVSEELIHGLSTMPSLRVVARTSSFAFRGQAGDVRAIGRALGAQTIVEGSVRRAGNRLRISARLVNTDTGLERWAERFEREFTDIFAVQDDMARAIVGALQGALVSRDVPVLASSTANVAAYELFLEGRFHWNRRSEASLRQAVESLRRAIALDPEFSQARALLALALVTQGIYGAAAPLETMPEARELAERALDSQPDSDDALTARGCVRALYDWDWAAAERDFRTAIALPHATPAAFQWFANVLIPTRRFDEARAQLARALELDPLSPVVAMSTGMTYLYERRFADATRAFRELLTRHPEFGIGWYFLGQSLVEEGAHDEARAALDRAVTLHGDAHEVLAARAVAAARSGAHSVAHALREKLDQRSAAQYVSPVLMASVHAALGDGDAALNRLEAARDLRATDLVWIGLRPVFDGLRDEPRFAQLLVDTGLHNRLPA
jgi:serine/threonine protein kinase/tetratricopeptide (TPR) repeat protein